MSSLADHISSVQLESYLDGTISDAERLLMDRHLAVCNVCRSAFDGTRQLEEALRSLPQERVSGKFTQSVLRALGLAPKVSLAFRLLENIAYLFGLLTVITVMLIVFTVTGVLKWGQIGESRGAAETIASGAFSALSGAVNGFVHFVQTYLPFVFAKGGSGIILAVIAVAAVVGLLDLLWGKRIVQR